jgi:plasmid stabilization system protein ParE
VTSRFVIAPAAEQDILGIGAYIEADNPAAARKLVAEIYDCFPRLAARPAMGHRRPDLTSLPVRFWTLRGRYMIVYREQTKPIEIVRVLSTYRDIAAILGSAKA